ncbi:hypothetical protein BIV57_13315 [Mangrovactinospora gilvigrisea]|uniref:Uncharacterized protein n=1 Tax=Mangrovactinospora gilvigrisea TaxID=1428644 RepID=A0A1J7BE55_9ACTN|nr:hypothetical protein [Mangrovactinospora gilvigrisea]OIV36967.1 hypothetical protein BIV57_13315 [Mangrovactinospora gilvigrisea]
MTITVQTMPLDSNGHRLSHGTTINVHARDADGTVVWHTGISEACTVCDTAPRLVAADGRVRAQDPCAYPDGFTTTITLDVPSGRIAVADDLRDAFPRDRRDVADYNTLLGQAQATLAMADLGCAYGAIDDTCPGLYRTGQDRYVIATPAYDASDNPTLPDTDRLATIVTDLWAYSVADADLWMARGGRIDRIGRSVTLVDIPPGRYEFTLHTGERAFPWDTVDEATLVYADIKRVTR